MNKCEKMMCERMNFVSRRGRTAEYQRNEWLKSLRAEREGDVYNFYVIVNGRVTYTSKTIRQGKILGLSIVNEIAHRHPDMRGKGCLTVDIYDKIAKIRIWEAER